MKKVLVLIVVVLSMALTSCLSDAQVASDNISTAADNFELNRRVVFYNVMTDKYILVVEGRCSIEKDVSKNQLAVTMKIGPKQFKKHYLGCCENMTYFSEQLESINVSTYHNRVIWKPSSILSTIEVK